MTNLTHSEARRLIDKLHHNQTKEHGISILEEKYLAALEIALPVLEQQPQTDTYRQIENDGWIEWCGNRAPVDLGATVEIRLKDGDIDKGPWSHFHWGRKCMNPIVAYRVIENDGREG